MGCIYKRGRIYWIKFYRGGRPIAESAGTTKQSEARRLLKLREGEAAEGKPYVPRAPRLRVEQLLADVLADYRVNGKRSLRRAELSVRHLCEFLGGRRALDVATPELRRYIEHRQAQAAANGTINRELACLRRGFNLAHQAGLLPTVPHVPMLKEAAPRQGFFERGPYEAVCRHLRSDLQVAATIEYTFGWRCQSEVLTLELRQLDLAAGTIRLDAGATKNDDGRLVYLPPNLKAKLATQVERVRALERQTGRIIPYLFPHLTGPFTGERVRDFRRAWATACRRAGVPGMWRHDFRRTAVRDMVNDGTPEKVAMMITGHKTRSVFDRYHIVSPADLQAAAARMETRKLTGTVSVTRRPQTAKMRGAAAADRKT